MAQFYLVLSFIYVFLRDLKDVLIVSLPQGTSLLVELKPLAFWFKLPFLGLFFLFYRKNNLLEILFTSIIVLLSVFLVFHFWIYPYAVHLHPSPTVIQELIQKHPESSQFLSIYGVWTYALYYLFTDLWGTFVLSFLFWALTNQTFTTKEAKLAYPLMIIIFPGLGNLLGGILLTFFSEARGNFTNAIDWVGYILLAGLYIFIICAWVIIRSQPTTPTKIETENLISIKFSLKFNIVYLILIFAIITSFGMCQQLINFMWKYSVKEYYTSADSYHAFLGAYSYYSGIGSLVIFLLTFWMIWKFGWLNAALIPPLLTLGTTLLLVLYKLSPEVETANARFFDLTNIAFVTWLFSIQTIVLKGIGALFLATKEMAYIPLPNTTKARGKAVVDFLFGGFGGTLMIAFLTFDLIPTGEALHEGSLTLLFVICVTSIVWITSIIYLGKMYKKALIQSAA